MDALPEDQLIGWTAYVDAVDHVKLIIRNESGGNKTYSSCDIKLSITKSLTDWGL